ncbi:hypothetical protein Glove_87g9 [Diversispora epigaea]|uniref:TLDc domain-containing protein n=1 Tax=Diversispora epigaea TaxID=1348612 RepID=A0A397JFC8_9GLOM|nr:hypothetical protein Glove_87g9 [Diversispora epigaea]
MTKKYNVVIEVDKKENKKSFTAHSVTLSIKKLESYLIESKASWLKTPFFFVYHSIFDKTALIPILKRDDLKVEEIKIWDYVIKFLEAQLWDAIIQHSISPNEPITSLVLPARIISTLNLVSRIVSTLNSIPRTISTPKSKFSTKINEEHSAEFSSWIDRKSAIYSLLNIPYEFQLILRGSRDGHADNSKEGDLMETNDSFIFSLKKWNIQNSILSRVIDGCGALRILMIRVVTVLECWCGDDNVYYEKPIRTTSKTFSIVDYELFND